MDRPLIDASLEGGKIGVQGGERFSQRGHTGGAAGGADFRLEVEKPADFSGSGGGNGSGKATGRRIDGDFAVFDLELDTSSFLHGGFRSCWSCPDLAV